MWGLILLWGPEKQEWGYSILTHWSSSSDLFYLRGGQEQKKKYFQAWTKVNAQLTQCSSSFDQWFSSLTLSWLYWRSWAAWSWGGVSNTVKVGMSSQSCFHLFCIDWHWDYSGGRLCPYPADGGRVHPADVWGSDKSQARSGHHGKRSFW